MNPLEGRVALVTGASRGVGRGVAVSLAHDGAIVYGTGRSIADAALPAIIKRLRCEHTVDTAVAEAFEHVRAEQGRLDILVNSAWGGYERMVGGAASHGPFRFGSNPSGGGMRCLAQASGPLSWLASMLRDSWFPPVAA